MNVLENVIIQKSNKMSGLIVFQLDRSVEAENMRNFAQNYGIDFLLKILNKKSIETPAAIAGYGDFFSSESGGAVNLYTLAPENKRGICRRKILLIIGNI